MEETDKPEPDWPELYEKYGLRWTTVANSVEEIGLEKTLEKFADAIKARSSVKNFIENVAAVVLKPSFEEIMRRNMCVKL